MIFEGTFIKVEYSETKEGFRVEEVTGKSLGVLCFGSLEKLQERSEPRWGCC